MTRALDYGVWWDTGIQDANNVFTPRDDTPMYDELVEEVRRGGDVEEKVRQLLLGEMMDFDDWVAQFDPEDEGYAPRRAYEQWVGGWVSAATGSAVEAIQEDAEGYDAEEAEDD